MSNKSRTHSDNPSKQGRPFSHRRRSSNKATTDSSNPKANGPNPNQQLAAPAQPQKQEKMRPTQTPKAPAWSSIVQNNTNQASKAPSKAKEAVDVETKSKEIVSLDMRTESPSKPRPTAQEFRPFNEEKSFKSQVEEEKPTVDVNVLSNPKILIPSGIQDASSIPTRQPSSTQKPRSQHNDFKVPAAPFVPHTTPMVSIQGGRLPYNYSYPSQPVIYSTFVPSQMSTIPPYAPAIPIAGARLSTPSGPQPGVATISNNIPQRPAVALPKRRAKLNFLIDPETGRKKRWDAEKGMMVFLDSDSEAEETPVLEHKATQLAQSDKTKTEASEIQEEEDSSKPIIDSNLAEEKSKDAENVQLKGDQSIPTEKKVDSGDKKTTNLTDSDVIEDNTEADQFADSDDDGGASEDEEEETEEDRQYSIEEIILLQPKFRDPLSGMKTGLKCSGTLSDAYFKQLSESTAAQRRHGAAATDRFIFGIRSMESRYENSRSKNRKSSRPYKSSGTGRGKKSRNTYTFVEPLVTTSDGWKRSVPEDEMEKLKRTVKSTLNKLTLDNFARLSEKLIAAVGEYVADSHMLSEVVQLIFDKALSESSFGAMYANLCRALHHRFPKFSDKVVGEDGVEKEVERTFKKLLIQVCQREFDAGFAEIVSSEGTTEADHLILQFKQKSRWRGLIVFVGELFKGGFLNKKVMVLCIDKLLSDPSEEDVEALCNLLNTVGPLFEKHDPKFLDTHFPAIHLLISDGKISQRARFLLLDLVDLRDRNWLSRKDKSVVNSANTKSDSRKQISSQTLLKKPVSTASRVSTVANRTSVSKVSTAQAPISKILPRDTPQSTSKSSASLAQSTKSSSVLVESSSVEESSSSLQDLEKKISSMAKEFFEVHDKNEVCEYLKDFEKLTSSEIFNPIAVRVLLALAVNTSKAEKQTAEAFKLLVFLSQKKLLTSIQVCDGIHQLVQKNLEDIIVDAPKFIIWLGQGVADLVINEAVSPKDFHRFWEKSHLVNKNLEQFILSWISHMQSLKGPEFARHVIVESNFDISIFLSQPMTRGVISFIMSNNLQDIFKPEVGVWTELQSKIPNYKMADYVHLLQHVSKSNFQKISYFRVIIESVFFAFTLPNGQRSLPAKKETISEEDAYLTGLIPIFRKLLDSGDLKLLAVCELQKLGLKFQFKNFFLQRSIRFLASNALIDKETLLAWEKSSMCIPGKVEALKVTRERPTE